MALAGTNLSGGSRNCYNISQEFPLSLIPSTVLEFPANASISHERELRLRLLRYATRMGAALQQLTTIHQSHLRRHRAMNEKKKKERKQNEGTHLYAPATHRYIL